MKILWKPSRWIALASYLAALMLTQFLSYSFSSILPVLAAHYSISATKASLAVLIFPVISALTSGVAGGVADRFGSRFSIRTGLVLIALFATLRACNASFTLLMLCQAGVAIGIPLVVTALSAFVAEQFPAARQQQMTSLCTVALFAGIGLSLGVLPWLVLMAGFSKALAILACIAILCCALFFLVIPRQTSSLARMESASTSWLLILQKRNVLLLCLGSFLGQGCFNAVITWIAIIWHDRGLPLQAAGTAGSAVVFAGILGSLLVPTFTRRMNLRTALWLCLIPATMLVQPFLWTGSLHYAYAYGALMGFFQFPSLAITLTLLAQSVPREHSGVTSGIYWMASNVGIFALSYLVDLVHRSSGWHTAVDCITALLFLVSVVVLFLRVPKEQAISASLP